MGKEGMMKGGEGVIVRLCLLLQIIRTAVNQWGCNEGE